jgi:hypothetical protein
LLPPSHDATGVSRQNATRTTIAEIKPAVERVMTVIASGVPKIGAATTAITAAGTMALFTADLMASSREACCGPTMRITGAGQPCQDETEAQSRVKCMRHVMKSVQRADRWLPSESPAIIHSTR